MLFKLLSKLGSGISGFFSLIKNKIKCFFGFVVVPPNQKEGLYSFLMRQFLASDSSGNPSWTVTILIFCIMQIFFISFYECILAMSYIEKFDAASGKLIYKGLRGFSVEFMGLAVTSLGSIMYIFRQKQKDKFGLPVNGSTEDTTPTPDMNPVAIIAEATGTTEVVKQIEDVIK